MPPTCSFCGKDSAQAANLITGPGVNICDECVNFCAGLLVESRGRTSSQVADNDNPAVEGVLFVHWSDGTTEEMKGLDLYLNHRGPVVRYDRFTRAAFGEPARIVLNLDAKHILEAIAEWAEMAFRVKDSAPEKES